MLNIVGARPNFIKIAPIHRIMKASPFIEPILVHTGQHYDEQMSHVFFTQLGLPAPDVYLGVGSGSHAQQTGAIMIALEKVMGEFKPDMVLVVGDVNSTMAAALVASKLNISIGHVEAGLRSFDRTMPEEINRVVTDALSDLLFVTEESGRQNLLDEGIASQKIYFVGNVMIDSLLGYLEKARKSNIISRMNLDQQPYALLTLHRPTNVDDKKAYDAILRALELIEREITIVFPIHPRAKKMLKAFQFNDRIAKMSNLKLIDPLGYLDFISLMDKASFVLTDSGGIQEETTVLGIPCITLRNNTERPITVTLGTNVIVGMDTDKIVNESFKILSGQSKKGTIPQLWDGNTAQRIVDVIIDQMDK